MMKGGMAGLMKQAQQKARDIQAAYEQVKEHRNIR